MKKILFLIVLSLAIQSCGPKRMRCYGKRCVEHQPKKELTSKTSKET